MYIQQCRYDADVHEIINEEINININICRIINIDIVEKVYKELERIRDINGA